jgi:hypothetical protein
MATLTKILKTSGSLTNVNKIYASTPDLRDLEIGQIKIIRALENGYKRLLETSVITDSKSIIKTLGSLSEILK